MAANDFAVVLGAVATLIVAIGGLAVFQQRKEPSQPKPDEALRRIEDDLDRIGGKIDILLDRIKR